MSRPSAYAARTLSPKGVRAAILGAALLTSCDDRVEPAPVITQVSPRELQEQTSQVVTISGDNFFGGASVDLSSARRVLINAEFVVRLRQGNREAALPASRESEHVVTFIAPATLGLGVYDVILATPRGLNAEADGALSIVSRNPVAGGAGGRAATGGSGGALNTGGSGGIVNPLTCSGGMSATSCVELQIAADIAECVDLSNPDPTYCEGLTGPGKMAVDLMDKVSGGAQRSYLKFTVPNSPPLGKLVSASLQLSGSNDSNTASPHSGDLWQVAPFDQTTLQQIPTALGGAALASDVGAVVQGQVVTWAIPVNRIASTGPLYLGVFPTDPDGTVYDNNRAPLPPRLLLKYAP